MTLIVKQIVPVPRGACNCAEFLAPLKTWKEVALRHDLGKLLRPTLHIVSDVREEWVIDLFRCGDCGRYWARECLSRATGYDFFYHVESDDPQTWLDHHLFWGGIKHRLKGRDAHDFEALIAPRLRTGEQERG